MRRIVVLTLIALLGPAPVVAVAASVSTATPVPALPGSTSPFSPGVPDNPSAVPTATTPTVTATATSTSTTSSGGLSGTNAILIAIGALVVLTGIAYFIWRDARRHAPVAQGHAHAGTLAGRSGSKAPPKKRKLSAAERRRRKRGRAR